MRKKIKFLSYQSNNTNNIITNNGITNDRITNNIITNNNDNSYNDFNIKLKKPIHTLKNHTHFILCLTILKDGRLVSGSSDKSIIIYNKKTFKPDLIIKEHNYAVSHIIQLSSGVLASCSLDKTIKLYNKNNYEIIQTLKYHKNAVNNIIELENKNLVSCSNDESIIFYYKVSNRIYLNYFEISTNGWCFSIIQTKANEICYSEYNNDTICFYDFFSKEVNSSLSNINKINDSVGSLILIRKDLLLIPGYNEMTIIDINKYEIIRVINVPDSDWIYGICLINQNKLLTGDSLKTIKQWEIVGDNLILISTKKYTHKECINVLLKIGDGHIASGSTDNEIKIW